MHLQSTAYDVRGNVSPVEARRLFTAEEVCLVLLVLLLWVAAIALFINRWGKIRMLEPCLPYKLATLGAETPMTVQNSRMNSTEEEPATSPSCRRQLSLMTPAGTQLSAPRRVKSAVDLVSLVMAEQLGAAARGGGGAPAGQPAAPGACGGGAGLGAELGASAGAPDPSESGWSAAVPPGPPCAARASHLWQTAARRGGECQIQVPVQVSADSFCSSPGSERAPPTSRARMVRVSEDDRQGEERTPSSSTLLATLPESVEFGVPLQRTLRPLQRVTKLLSLRTVTAQMQMALAVSSQELQRQEVLHSYVGGADDGSDDEATGGSSRPRGLQKSPSRAAVSYWPPQSWSLLEPQKDEEEPTAGARSRRARPTAPTSAKQRRQRRPRPDEVQVGFTDKNRDVAVTDGHDIKLSLRQCRQVEASVVDIRATWWTYVSEAEKAARRGQHRYACQLFDKCLRMEPPPAAVCRCRVGRSVSCRRLKQLKQALAEARLALEADGGNPRARLALADALYASGELELALVAYWRGLQVRPGLEELRQGTRRCEDRIMRVIGKVPHGKMTVPPGYKSEPTEQEDDDQPTPLQTSESP
ncbi:Tetratricopeptide repeat protein 25 [Amphibalanus amphitrite]|uniref:Outer dynein arm-docking complex subunit 4 n=1 Tax=Amphibalanus amphitrite TaxID=1232801 RepID=A0A6A4W2E9_AMPAM|nr:Tetratricopeptide repeat protein 25 [Amphibalanus amphitrite]